MRRALTFVGRLFGGPSSLGCLPIPVIFCQVAVLAQALGVVETIIVGAGPRFLGAAASMVAIDAHVLCVVLAFFMRTLLANED